MTKRELIIPPRLTLPIRPSLVDTVEMEVSVEGEKISQPTRPMKRRKARNVRQTLSIVVRELVYLLVAGDLGTIAYWYLAPWPVYRIVSFVVIFILWSNFASSAARVKTKQAIDMLSTVSMQAVQAGTRSRRKQAVTLQEDTAAYLEAMQRENYETIETHRLHAVVPDHHSNRGILHYPEVASD